MFYTVSEKSRVNSYIYKYSLMHRVECSVLDVVNGIKVVMALCHKQYLVHTQLEVFDLGCTLLAE